MKILLTAVLFLFASCATTYAVSEPTIPVSTVLMCVDSQVELYGDLCSEADTDGPDAHFNGVKCAVEAIKVCLEVEK